MSRKSANEYCEGTDINVTNDNRDDDLRACLNDKVLCVDDFVINEGELILSLELRCGNQWLS